MSNPDFSELAKQHTQGADTVPEKVAEWAGGRPVDLVWRNELGGLTFCLGQQFVKWNPNETGIDLDRERDRLRWISERHPAPRVVASGREQDAQWMVTEAVPGESAVGDIWRARRSEAIEAIAAGLRAIHALSIEDFPIAWVDETWVTKTPSSIGSRPPVDRPVLVHGDACAPNTLISTAGDWTGHVDFGDLAVGDRWADLAVASLSLDWNFGEGHQQELFDAYGVDPDPVRIAYYRSLWDLES